LNLCYEPDNPDQAFHNGYRIDLIYDKNDAVDYAHDMMDTYGKLGYKYCKLLKPQEVVDLDPSLRAFCQQHSTPEGKWKAGSTAILRPGGCIKTEVFLPKFYDYLKKVMGQYTNEEGKIKDCFRLKFDREVTGVIFQNNLLWAIQFANGKIKYNDRYLSTTYVFCPGEAVGTLTKLGFKEPAYAGFAGPSLKLNIPIPDENKQEYLNMPLNHWMEVHKQGVVLAWQASSDNEFISIKVAGTKAFYGDIKPYDYQKFCIERNLLQLNMINDIAPQLISLALGFDTTGIQLSKYHLKELQNRGIAECWVGVRSVYYDGVPVLGEVFTKEGKRIDNARATTGLGSGGVSFGPACVRISMESRKEVTGGFVSEILRYASSTREPNTAVAARL